VASKGGNHRFAYRAAPDQCPRCHGADLTLPGSSGGIAKVSCSSTSFQGIICHANGHVPRLAPHPLPFTNPALHGPLAKADLSFCQRCHATSTGGAGSNPRFNGKIGDLVNGCEDCHNFLTAHPSSPPNDTAPWRGPFSHQNAQNLTGACALCHGANLNGVAEGGVGPACSSCHRLSVLTNKNCSSCHGSGQAGATAGLPAGAAYPDTQGAHNRHNALNKVTGACASCHTGAGIGSLSHFDQTLEVSLPASYNAKTGGPAIYLPDTVALSDPASGGGSCANVSCHGGQTTPAWRTGSVDPATECPACHRARAVSDQFNSYFSGRPVAGPPDFPSLHDFHLDALNLACIDCHDGAKLAPTHFVALDTPQFEGVPAASIRAVINYLGGSCTPDPTALYTVNIGCHGTRSWAQ